MIPGNLPLTLYRGDTGRWQFKLWTDAAKTVPADLTDATAAAQIRDKPGGENVTELACSVTPPNIIDMTLTAAQSALLPPAGAWDLQLTYTGSGDVATVLAGKVIVTSDVTNAVTVRRTPALVVSRTR